MSNQLQRTPSNENTTTRRRDGKKKTIILSTILFFLLAQILIYNQGKHYLSSLEDEISEWKYKYNQSVRRLKRSERLFQREKLKWKDKIKTVRDGMFELDTLHEEEEGRLKGMYLESMKNYKMFNEQGPVLPTEEVKTNGADENKEQTKKKPLNIVLLYADDWRHDTFGAAGNPVIKTPNLDRMAKEGVMFTENCVTTSVCWISRGTLQTGQYLSRHKSPLISDAVFVREAWNETYNYLLRKNGYHTGFVGKWHYHQFPASEFDVAKQYYGWHMDPSGTRHITEQNEIDGLNFLRNRPQDKPFALTISFYATHAIDGSKEQFIPQNRSMELYKDVEIPTKSSVSQESWERLPYFFTDRNEGRLRWLWRFDTPEKYQHMMKNYYRMASEVDTVVGNVIQELKDQGVYDNTLIIFTTDNGYYHGEHGLADKWYPHQESIRVPLVILDPRIHESKKGIPNHQFTLNIDLAPTMLHAAGITPPERMQGRDISQLYTTSTSTTKWRDEFYYEHPTIDDQEWWIPTSEALVRKNYKYFYWTHYKEEQLFDMLNDPLEENDLVKQLKMYDDPDLREKSIFYRDGDNVAKVQVVLEEMRLQFQVLKEAAK